MAEDNLGDRVIVPATGSLRVCAAQWLAIGIVCAGTLVAARPATAQPFESVGVRALGMGGAFVAVADDATANYWNPAGLASVFFSAVLDVQRTETRLGPDQLSLQGTRDGTTFVSMASPSVGLSYYRVRSFQLARPAAAEPASLKALQTQHAGLTLVQPFLPGVTLATVVKVVRGTVAVGLGDGLASAGDLFAQASALEGPATTRFDLDVGLMVSLGRARFGLVGRNLREPEFASGDGQVMVLERQLRAGLMIHPTDSLILAVDADLSTLHTVIGPRRAVAVGAEQHIGRLVVRAGGRVNVEEDRPQPVGAVGLSLEVMTGLWFDAQFSGGRDQGDQGWGVSTRIGF